MPRKVFVTGATGFVGSHLVWKLREQGDEVRCLVRRPSKAGWLQEIGAKIVAGDVTNRVSMRTAMRDCDCVYHLAALTGAGHSPKRVTRLEKINVIGTRNVLSLAHNIGVPKIVYASSAAVLGDTQGVWADEGFTPRGQFSSPYLDSKRRAHYEVVLPLIAEGAPVMVIMPGLVYGPDATGAIGQLFDKYIQRRLRMIVGGEALYTWVYVDDLAQGYLQAASRGCVGESYILTGPALSIKGLLQQLESLCHIPAPRIVANGTVKQVAASTLAGLSKVLPFATGAHAERLKAFSKGTYLVKSEKARRQLGWDPRPLEEGLQSTLDWYLSRDRQLSLGVP
jgi:dihydroflavonol-4-reductase